MVEQRVREVEQVEQDEELAADDVVLDRVVAVAASPTHDEQDRDVVDQVERGQDVQRVAQARVLHQHDTPLARDGGPGSESDRAVLAGRGEVPQRRLVLLLALLEQAKSTGEEAAGDARGEREALIDQRVEKQLCRLRRCDCRLNVETPAFS
jgi:hypothetical protein